MVHCIVLCVTLLVICGTVLTTSWGIVSSFVVHCIILVRCVTLLVLYGTLHCALWYSAYCFMVYGIALCDQLPRALLPISLCFVLLTLYLYNILYALNRDRKPSFEFD